MADRISDLSGEEREQRIAELKARMQESARRRRAEGADETDDSPPPAEAPIEASSSVDSEPAVEETTISAPAEESEQVSAPTTQTAETVAPQSTATTPKPSPKPAPKPAPRPTAASDEPSPAEMNRREFLTYAWGGALGLLALEGLGLSFAFMYPRFRAGEFGGVFGLDEPILIPETTAPPEAYPNGKFWMVATDEEEPKALYMVCTHLGCLYQWVQSNNRFECPCHGSKFTKEGYYIEGPAPRSLDYFELETEGDRVLVDTGARQLGLPADVSPANASSA